MWKRHTARVRANLKDTPSDNDLHMRFLKKLDEQETQIEKYQADIKKLQTGARLVGDSLYVGIAQVEEGALMGTCADLFGDYSEDA